MQRDYVTFFSPGTLYSESSSVPMETGWSIDEAIARSRGIEERYGAKPYGFRFSTWLEAGDVEVDGHRLKVEPKKLRESGMHFLTGEVRGAAEVLAGTDPDEDMLRSNVRCNGFNAIVQNRNSYLTTLPFREDDLLVDWGGTVLARGADYIGVKASP